MRSSALMEALKESRSQAPQHELYELEGLLYLTFLYFRLTLLRNYSYLRIPLVRPTNRCFVVKLVCSR